MIRGMESVLLFSENAKKLAAFYRDVVGLKVTFQRVMGEGQDVYEFKLKGTTLNILDHSDVKGRAREPKRFMVNLEVDDIEDEVARLKGKKVKVIQDIYHVQDYGYIATLEDPDGNYFQFVQVRAS